ncbi:MAG: LLM class flavin-dependent oxidoreductase [Pseudomonadota bacterium]|nr:LLM class flavin-dependent oxidoreductase [Pseudomonadota bacterium]
MEFGLQFFPDVAPEEKSGRDYFSEALRLVDLCDDYGYTHVRIVEHYFHQWGGYSPNPLIFLTAASQRTRKARLIPGAVLPVFNHPLKLAGEIGMLDAISGGRLEVGFARAFVPHEYERFGVSLDESVARFDEGLAQIARLLEEENVTETGQFHSFANVTSLPRPTQRPRPAFWTAATTTPESFDKAGRMGNGLMAIPAVGAERMPELCGRYREAWKSAGHDGNGRVMMALYLSCHEDREEARRIADAPLTGHMRSAADSAGQWTEGVASADYKGYDKLVAGLKKETFESQFAKKAIFVGTPDDIIEQIHEFDRLVGGVDLASLDVNFNSMAYEDAARSAKLFGKKVIPHFTSWRH